MDVGKILQDARTAKNLSLETAAQETNIRKAYLEAIEQNDFALLHGDVFVKGIMRTYGNYLGLDGAQLVEEYKTAGIGTARVKNNNSIRESHHVKVRPTFKSNRDIGSGNGDGHGFLFIIAGILVAVLAIAGGIYFYLNQTGKDIHSMLPFRFNNVSEMKADETKAKENHIDEKKIEDAVKPSVKAEEESRYSEDSSKKVSATAVPDKITVSGSGSNTIKVTSTGKCWLRVTDQKGTVLFEGNLFQGESKSFSSNSNIIMRIGNLKDLQIEHNGKALPFEAANEAVTRVFTPKE